jgi:putative transposase
MNAHIESFHSILERDCYSMNEFESYIHVYEVVSKYMDYYNNRYRHKSLGNKPPADYYQSLKEKKIQSRAFIA